MELSTLDYSLIIVFYSLVLGIGVYISKKSGKDSTEFFLSGRTMPWRLLGMVVFFNNRHTYSYCLCQALADIRVGHGKISEAAKRSGIIIGKAVSKQLN